MYEKSVSFNEEIVLQYFKQKGFTSYSRFTINNYELLLYRKQLLNEENYIREHEHELFVCGSLFYKSLGFKSSLQQLLEDIIVNKVDNSDLYGNYIYIYYEIKTGKTLISVDPAHIKNIYYDSQNRILSTDLLSIYVSNSQKYTVNRNAIIENIISGMLISPDTYFNEIFQIDKINFSELNTYFPSIEFEVIYPQIKKNIDDKASAIESANLDLEQYFEKVSKISAEYGAHLGLTGGFDSRLLLIHAKKNIKDLHVNSFWRKNSKEFENAELLAKAAGKELFSLKDFEYTFLDIQFQGMYHFGGEIRSQNYWSEIFNTASYSTLLANGSLVGFHGCGGEEYRNAERFRSANIDDYIKYEVLFKLSKDVFKNKAFEKQILNHIKNKVLRILELDINRFTLYEHKRYQNEIWNSANRATRVNALNQLMFYFAPFTEYQISFSAYDYIKHLGISLEFQQLMIKQSNYKLAQVVSNYGFTMVKGETYKMMLRDKIISVLPRVFVHYMFHHYLKNKNHINESQFQEALTYIKEYFVDIDGIDWDLILKNSTLNKNLVSFELLLKYLQEK